LRLKFKVHQRKSREGAGTRGEKTPDRERVRSLLYAAGREKQSKSRRERVKRKKNGMEEDSKEMGADQQMKPHI